MATSYKDLYRGLAAGAIFTASIAVPLAVQGTHIATHTGANLWANKCHSCHGTPPSYNQLNAAGTSSAVLAHVIATQGTMKLQTSLNTTNFDDTDRTLVANYIATQLPSVIASTAQNTPVAVNVSNNLSLTGVAFTGVQTCAGTSLNGSTGTWSGTGVTFTPTAGFVGQASFKYRGVGSVSGDCRTATINVGSAPNITSPGSKAGTVGVFTSYTITADNAPTGYSHTGILPAGMTRSGNLISGTPTTATSYSPVVYASNAWGFGPGRTVNFTIGQGSNSISFSSPSTAPVTYSPGLTATATASATSGLAVSLASTTTTVCTASGTNSTTINVLTGGTCTISASQAGNGNYVAASTVTRSFLVNKAAQSITFAQPTTPVTYSPGGTIGATATAPAGAVTLATTTPDVCSGGGSSPQLFTILKGGTCTITATQAGDARYNAAIQVVRDVVVNATVPGAPTLGTVSASDSSVSVSFSAPANNGGSTITGYTASCTPSGSNSGTLSPIAVGGLANGTSYTCSVRAQNAVGLGAASGSGSATPSPTPVAPAITSANNATFTTLVPGTFNVTGSGVPAPSFAVAAGTLPGGITLAPAGTLSGTPASGTSGTHVVTIRASNGVPPNNDQVFTLTVAKQAQAISFPAIAPATFGAGPVPVSASASPSGLAAAITSATPGVCSITGANVNLLSTGDCTLDANQAGNADFAPAPTVTRTFTISKGNQTLDFPAQAVPSRPMNVATFEIAPLATASSGLGVTYEASSSPAVCTVSGTTVTMLGVGTCRIDAIQAGDGNWNAAPAVSQDITFTIGSQAITFGAQAPQSFVSGGSFTLNPVATSSSNLAVEYSSLTPAVCTENGTTITMLYGGTCTIAADQDGDANYAPAARVTRDITINPTVPGIPLIGSASSVASGQLNVAFTAPTSDGGSPITGYTATCNPGAASASGTTSPLLVTGLTNSTLYSCTVTASNLVGTSAASAAASGTPSSSAPNLWATVCSACHGPTPAVPRFNAAGTTTTVLSYVIANRPEMQANPVITGLSEQQKLDLVAYITGFMAPVQQVVAPGTPRTISVASHLTLGIVAFDAVEIVSPPTSGTLGAFVGTSALYTPAPGFTGTATFTYRGINTVSGLVGDTHTATIQVDATARVFTVNFAGPAGAGVVLVADPGGTRTCTATCVETYANNTNLELLAAPDAGYAFTGWSGACAGVDSCMVTMNAGKQVTATFAPATRQLTVATAGTGSGSVSSVPLGIECSSSCAVSFAENAIVTLTALSGANSTFAGWSGACAGTGTCQVTMDQARSVTATFNLQTHFLTVAKGGSGAGDVMSAPGGIACGITCAAPYGHGTLVSLTPTAAAGSSFTGWSGACSGSGACNVTMDQARSVTATFAVVVPSSTLTVTKAGTGAGSVVSSPAGIDCGGTCAAPFPTSSSVTLFASSTAGATFEGWSGACSGNGLCVVDMSAARNVTATFTGPPGMLAAGTAAIDFGAQSMGTTSLPRTATVTNVGSAAVTVTGVASTSPAFTQTNDCGLLVPGASCTIAVVFSPTVQSGPFNGSIALGGTLSVAHDGPGGPLAITVFGAAEKSLVSHFYQAVLGRFPDASGASFWRNEASRVVGLGARVNETWFAMAQAFFASSEYLAQGRGATGFVSDLYATFFNRAPDAGGSAYWASQIAQGMPREVVLSSFMFSAEFAAFTQSIFGSGTARAEVDLVIDFYRGILSRLPDNGGFLHWVGQFRSAQCSGAAAVYAQADAISRAYINSAEYAARNRSSAQYVGDLYNAFLRRGGDLGGVLFWVGQIDSGARTRESVRQAFIGTPEFGARVQAIVNEGCLR